MLVAKIPNCEVETTSNARKGCKNLIWPCSTRRHGWTVYKQLFGCLCGSLCIGWIYSSWCSWWQKGRRLWSFFILFLQSMPWCVVLKKASHLCARRTTAPSSMVTVDATLKERCTTFIAFPNITNELSRSPIKVDFCVLCRLDVQSTPVLTSGF